MFPLASSSMSPLEFLSIDLSFSLSNGIHRVKQKVFYRQMIQIELLWPFLSFSAIGLFTVTRGTSTSFHTINNESIHLVHHKKKSGGGC